MNPTEGSRNRELYRGTLTMKKQVWRLLSEGSTAKGITTHLNLAVSTIYKWKAEFKKFAPESLLSVYEADGDIPALIVEQWKNCNFGNPEIITRLDTLLNEKRGKSEVIVTYKTGQLEKHFNDLVKVAESLVYNLKIPSPQNAQQEALLLDNKKYEKITGLEALKEASRDVFTAWKPGPKWYRFPNGSVQVGFIAEEWELFPALIEHLKGTELNSKFWELKHSLKKYTELCISLEGKVSTEDLPGIPEVAHLYEKSKQLSDNIANGLKVFIHKREFTGRCRYCP